MSAFQPRKDDISEVCPFGQVKQRLCRCEVLHLWRKMKLNVPHIVPKAHFTHEVRFTCGAYFTFRKAEHLVEKNPLLSVDKRGFFSGAGDRDRTGTLLPARDFKSRASACSATPALPVFYHLRRQESRCRDFFYVFILSTYYTIVFLA